MKEFNYTVTDPVGIHARPAGNLVKEAKKYECAIMIYKGEKGSKATSLTKLMGLGIKQGDEIRVTVEGDGEEECAAAMEKFFKENL